MTSSDDHHEDNVPGLPFDLSQLAAFLTPSGPVNLDAARQIANWTALHTPDGEGLVDAVVDDEHFAEVSAAAAAHIAALFDDPELRQVRVIPLTRREWAERQLTEFLPVLTSLSNVVSAGLGGAQLQVEADELARFGIDPSMIQSLVGSLAPTMVGSQAGSLLGALSHVALGRYDIAVPAEARREIWLVPGNIANFATSWELDHDEVVFVVAAHELLHNVLRSAPAFREEFSRLMGAFADGYEFDPEHLAQSVFDGQEFDPEAMSVPAADPMAFLQAMRTDAQAGPRLELRRFVAVAYGIVNTLLRTSIRPLVSTFDVIGEAMRRNRIECSSTSAFLEALLGVDLTREEYEAGDRFVEGVLDRAEFAGLAQLWTRPDGFPTSTEFEAPGLWLARLELSS